MSVVNFLMIRQDADQEKKEKNNQYNTYPHSYNFFNSFRTIKTQTTKPQISPPTKAMISQYQATMLQFFQRDNLIARVPSNPQVPGLVELYRVGSCGDAHPVRRLRGDRGQ